MGVKKLVLITSVIHADSSLSVYTPQERLEQLLNLTIPSIIEKIKDPYIVLCEGSDLSEEEISVISKKVDHIHYKNNKGYHKSAGEIFLISSFLKSEKYQDLKDIEYDQLIKISARYYLTEDFDNKLLEKPFIAKFYEDGTWSGHGLCETRFYALPASYIKEYEKRLDEVLEKGLFIDLEHSFFHYQVLPIKDIISQESIGVKGSLAPNRQIVND